MSTWLCLKIFIVFNRIKDKSCINNVLIQENHFICGLKRLTWMKSLATMCRWKKVSYVLHCTCTIYIQTQHHVLWKFNKLTTLTRRKKSCNAFYPQASRGHVFSYALLGIITIFHSFIDTYLACKYCVGKIWVFNRLIKKYYHRTSAIILFGVVK